MYKPTMALLRKRQHDLNTEAGQWAKALGTSAAYLRELAEGTFFFFATQLMDGTS